MRFMKSIELEAQEDKVKAGDAEANVDNLRTLVEDVLQEAQKPNEAEVFGLGRPLCSAIDPDEWFASTGAHLVDGARQDFFASARLTSDQHRHGCLG